MTDAYEAPTVEAVTPVDAPLNGGPSAAPSVQPGNPQWAEEPEPS